jgi:4-hydroxy-tetrahydrodipicolinate synthase
VSGSILAASLTPLRRDGSIDDARFAEHVEWLLANGCDGVVLFGTTGEGNSFSVSERQEALDALMESGVDAGKLVVGTGCCALPDTIELTRHATEHGVQASLVLPPYYYKNVTDDGLFDTFAKLIDTVTDPALRVWLYHIPPMAVVGFSADLVAKLVEAYPQQIVGIKDSSGDQPHTEMLNERFPSLEVFAGTENFLLDFLRKGGAGCISATANVTAALCAEVRDRQDSIDAEALQEKLSRVRLAFQKHPATAVLKAYIARRSSHSDWALVREPLSTLDDSKLAELDNDLGGLL